MTTEKQRAANLANASKSTGPRSHGGKARSRLNSRKHGLTANTLIIVGEYADDFEQLRAELMAEHDPQSVLETELVERLAGILWRLRRVPFFEAAILDTRHQQVWSQKSHGPARGRERGARRRERRQVRTGRASVNLGNAPIETRRQVTRSESSLATKHLMNALHQDATDARFCLQDDRRATGRTSRLSLRVGCT